ncbi:Fic family protein [Methanobrevibacter filiformis]|uniref:Adenosine monophosphate-protein transferase SoFic n=1 Tax=Methanobrevibacter filiformis TaxID=55758 RepID=A0A166DG05_9EURY|nr:Fic family protein [Methanobrevibacter filiformis]KZX15566.1 adenosine monophosphate-protein transferase SoFic [Methanobrevibacter filiformis]
MFKPNFKYTNKIVNNLTFIAESKAIIMNAPLVPKWEVSLRKDAILESAHFSTAIEGNTLTLDEVGDLADGKNVMARLKDKQEVLNYLNTLKKIPDFAIITPFKCNDLLKIHKILTDGTLEDTKYEGVIRDRQVYVGRSDGSIAFMPPKTKYVLTLVNDFLGWFNQDLNEVDPVIVAGVVHYELVRIHPFIDGNGRIARIMATLVLHKRNFDLKRFFVLDSYYDMNRPNYYKALRSVNQDTLDLTKWLEYFTDGVAFSMRSVRDKVLGISKNVKILKEKGQISLTERQMLIVEKILSNGKIANKDIRNMFSISHTSANREISKLKELKVIKQVANGRNTHYVLI